MSKWTTSKIPPQAGRVTIVTGATDLVSAEHEQLDVLVNNAAVMALPKRQLTVDGFEMQFGLLSPFCSHAPAAGALPTLFAATDPEAKGGGYYGPNGFYELKGGPGPSQVSLPALDQKTANDLWEVSEQLTGVPFPPVAP